MREDLEGNILITDAAGLNSIFFARTMKMI
jgi:hypothetical protein